MFKNEMEEAIYKLNYWTQRFEYGCPTHVILGLQKSACEVVRLYKEQEKNGKNTK